MVEAYRVRLIIYTYSGDRWETRHEVERIIHAHSRTEAEFIVERRGWFGQVFG